jgi:hypothetical protein
MDIRLCSVGPCLGLVAKGVLSLLGIEFWVSVLQPTLYWLIIRLVCYKVCEKMRVICMNRFCVVDRKRFCVQSSFWVARPRNGLYCIMWGSRNVYQYWNVTVTSVRSMTLVNAYRNSVQTGNQFQRNFMSSYCHSNRWKWLSVMWLGPSATLPQCGALSPPSWRRFVAVLCIYTPPGMRYFN